MCKLTKIVQYVPFSVKEMHEGYTRLIGWLLSDSYVETADITGAPVLLDTLLYEVVLVHFLALRPLHCVEIWTFPHVADMLLSVLLRLIFANTEDQHGLRVLQVLKVKDGHWRVPVRVIEQLRFHNLLLHDLVLIHFHLICHSVAYYASALGKL